MLRDQPSVGALPVGARPRTLAVIWATAAAKPQAIRLQSDKIQLWDTMGRPQPSRQFTPDGTPVYLLSDELPPEAFPAALGISGQPN